jgi:microcystin-dependent protein
MKTPLTGWLTAAAVAACTCLAPLPVQAQANDPYMGQIMIVAFTFCPRGWLDASGQIMSISQNAALFSLLGTTYGGDGIQTFALPNMQGRVAMDVASGSGLPNANQGMVMGAPSTTLTIANLPAHSHQFMAASAAPTTGEPTGNVLGTFPSTQHIYAPGPATKPMSVSAVGLTGNNAPIDLYQPSLVLRYCIAIQGVFPSRP